MIFIEIILALSAGWERARAQTRLSDETRIKIINSLLCVCGDTGIGV